MKSVTDGKPRIVNDTIPSVTSFINNSRYVHNDIRRRIILSGVILYTQFFTPFSCIPMIPQLSALLTIL